MLELAPDFIQNIDWELLKKQKQTLLEVISKNDKDIETFDALTGILDLIDAVQDYAVDFCELDENDVYDFN